MDRVNTNSFMTSYKNAKNPLIPQVVEDQSSVLELESRINIISAPIRYEVAGLYKANS